MRFKLNGVSYRWGLTFGLVLAIHSLVGLLPQANADSSVFKLRCQLTNRSAGLQELTIVQFTGQDAILYTSETDRDGAGLIRSDIGAQGAVFEFSNECDNLFRLEFAQHELVRLKESFRNGVPGAESAAAQLEYWQDARPNAAIRSELQCVVF